MKAPSRRDLPKRARTASLLVVLLALVTVSAVACGVAGEVGDGGIVSTVEEPTETTTTAAPDSTTTTSATVVDGTTTTSKTSSSAATTTTAGSADSTTFRVYFNVGEKIYAFTRVIPKTQQVGAEAMKALLEGPTDEELENARMVSDNPASGDEFKITNIPEGTTFLGLEIKDGIATVDLSKEFESGGGHASMAMRLAQVVFTLTQFPTVQGVNFKLDGEPREVISEGEGVIIDHPQTRADYEELSPAILVESPTLGGTASSPMRITGTANVFEAVFRVNIVNWDGLIIADEIVMATSGTGTRGTFDVTIPFDLDRDGLGAIIVFSDSPKDGSQINIVEIPLQLEK